MLRALDGLLNTITMYRLALVYFMCGQAQLRDDEAVQDQRAAAFMAMYSSELGTVS